MSTSKVRGNFTFLDYIKRPYEIPEKRQRNNKHKEIRNHCKQNEN